MGHARRTFAILGALLVATAVPPVAGAAPPEAASWWRAESAATSTLLPAQPIAEDRICQKNEKGRFKDCKTGVYTWNIREGGRPERSSAL